jgi:hypothetical protein
MPASPLGRVKRRNVLFLLLRMLNGVALRSFRTTFPLYLGLNHNGTHSTL